MRETFEREGLARFASVTAVCTGRDEVTWRRALDEERLEGVPGFRNAYLDQADVRMRAVMSGGAWNGDSKSMPSFSVLLLDASGTIIRSNIDRSMMADIVRSAAADSTPGERSMGSFGR